MCSSTSPTGQSWPHPQRESAPDAVWPHAESPAIPPAATLGGGRCRDDPTRNAPFETKTPSCATTYTHNVGCRARGTHARAPPTTPPPQEDGSPTGSPPPPPRPPPPLSAPPSVSSASPSASGGARRHGGRPSCPCLAAGRPDATQRCKQG